MHIVLNVFNISELLKDVYYKNNFIFFVFNWYKKTIRDLF